jgi:hypothetical protein
MHHSPTTPAFREPVARFFGLEAVPVASPEPAAERPVLRVIPGGTDAVLRRRLRPEVYRRRRLTMLAVLSLLLVLAAAVLDRGHDTPSPTAPPPAASVQAEGVGGSVDPDPGLGLPVPSARPAGVYVVQPGDTLWGIAHALDPDGDIRPLVDELARRAGSGPLEAGTRIDLSDLGG